MYKIHTNSRIIPRLGNFSPFGPVAFETLLQIYHATLYLGNYVYLNEDIFNEDLFENGLIKRPITFTLKDMCEIAEFDFFRKPFVPGQPLEYYTQFLLPLKKVLTKFKKVVTNKFFVSETNYSEYLRYIKATLYSIKYDTFVDDSGYTVEVVGEDRLENERDLTKWKNACNSFYDNSLAGYKVPTATYTNESNVLALQAQAEYVENYRQYYDSTDDTTKYEYYSGWRFNEMNYRDRYTLIANRNIPTRNKLYVLFTRLFKCSKMEY